MVRVEDFIYTQEKGLQEVLHYLHQILQENFNLDSKIRYRVPFYYHRSWICYLNPNKKGGLELVFIRGNQLSNAHGLLLSKGRKQVAGMDIYSLHDLPQEALFETIQEAIILDETVPYSVNRKKK